MQIKVKFSDVEKKRSATFELYGDEVTEQVAKHVLEEAYEFASGVRRLTPAASPAIHVTVDAPHPAQITKAVSDALDRLKERTNSAGQAIIYKGPLVSANLTEESFSGNGASIQMVEEENAEVVRVAGTQEPDPMVETAHLQYTPNDPPSKPLKPTKTPEDLGFKENPLEKPRRGAGVNIGAMFPGLAEYIEGVRRDDEMGKNIPAYSGIKFKDGQACLKVHYKCPCGNKGFRYERDGSAWCQCHACLNKLALVRATAHPGLMCTKTKNFFRAEKFYKEEEQV